MATDVGQIYFTVDARTGGLLSAERQVDSSTRRMERSFSTAGRSAKSFEDSLHKLSGVAAAVGSALAVQQVVQYTDAFNNAQNQIRQVTRTHSELTAVTDRLLQVADQSRSGFEATANLYSRLARSTTSLNLSQEQLFTITRAVQQSFAVSGASAQEAESAIVQLGQGLASGALRGDEFNSVAEQAPGILRAVSKYLNVSVGDLRNMAANGKITANTIAQAMLSASDSIENELGRSVETAGQKFTRANNQMLAFLGTNDRVQSAVGDLGDGALLLTSNLDKVVTTATALAAVLGARLVGRMQAAVVAQLALVAANQKEASAAAQAAAANAEAGAAQVRRTAAERQTAFALLNTAKLEAQATAGTNAHTFALQQLSVARARASEAAAAHAAATRASAGATALAASTARNASVVMNGLRGAFALLGGPAGVILLAAFALYQFRDSLTESGRAAQEAEGKFSGLTDELYRLSDAQLAVKRAELTANLINAQIAAGKAQAEIERLNAAANDLSTAQPGDALLASLSGLDGVNLKGIDVRENSNLDELRDQAASATAEVEVLQKALNSVKNEQFDRKQRPTLSEPTSLSVDDNEAKKLKSEFDKVKKELDTQREAIEREYQERNATILKATAAGSDEQEDLLARSAAKRKQQLQELSDQLVGITASQIDRINAQYEAQRREILEITEKGSAEQIEAVVRNEANRQRAIDQYRAQELGNLRSQTEQVTAEYRQQQQHILDATVEGSAERQALQEKSAAEYQVSLLNAQAQELLATQTHQQALLEAEQAMYAARLQAQDGWTAEAAAKLAEFQTNAADPAKYLTDSLQNAFVNLDDTIATTFTNGIRQGESFGEIMTNVGRSIVAELLQSVIKLGVQMAINAALGNTYAAASAATAAATGASMAAAYAPAAAMASLASFGANAIPAAAALTSTTALASTMALAGGRQYGGNVNAGSLYRVTEDGKPEMYTDGTQSYLLPGRNGKVTANKDMGSGYSGTTVHVNLYGSAASGAQVSQREGVDRQQIIDIILDDSYNNGPIRQSYGV